MLSEIVAVAVAQLGQLGSMVAPVLILALWRVFDRQSKESNDFHKTVSDSIKMLKENDLNIIRSKLHDKIECYLDRGSVTWDELQIAEALFDRYTKLGGNSFIATGMDKVRKLPVTHSEEESNA